jgi:hypothetical protein
MDAQAAINRRDSGISLAVEKADRDVSGWSDSAFYALMKYISEHPDPFLAEEAREWCESEGYVTPPENGRAWGAVFQRASRVNAIKKAGYDLAKSSNFSPKVLWVRFRENLSD